MLQRAYVLEIQGFSLFFRRICAFTCDFIATALRQRFATSLATSARHRCDTAIRAFLPISKIRMWYQWTDPIGRRERGFRAGSRGLAKGETFQSRPSNSSV